MYHYSCPTSPRNRPTMIHRYGLGTGCIIIFDDRRISATKVCYELLWYPNTYDFARGLALSNHLSSPSAAVVEQSEGESFPYWTLRPPRLGRPSFSCLPQMEGESSSSSSSFSREECVLELSDDVTDTTWRRELFRVPVAFFLVFSSTS